jgi:hypothetical protein
LRGDVPGFEQARLHALAATIGVRESRRVRGRAYLTRRDYEEAAKFPDGICRVNYEIDIHSPTGQGTELVPMPPGEWYEIPYGCLVPRGCENLLLAGRPISVDHAAMAVRAQATPAELDGADVRRSLIEQGVWLED